MPVCPFRRHAKEKHRAGHLFEDVGEVLRPHHRLVEAAETGFAKQIGADRFTHRDRAGIAIGDRKTGGDLDGRAGAVGRSDAGSKLGQGSV